MGNGELYAEAGRRFRDAFGHVHSVAAYAPGRVEILGNHTDYNEGFVLSAAIDFGTYVLVSRTSDGDCRLVAGDLSEEAHFAMSSLAPSKDKTWPNYVMGVLDGLARTHDIGVGFHGLLLGNIPLGAGLSSSAALEMATGLALATLYELDVTPLDLARIGQAAEHTYVGVQCGLLDQISSLFGKRNHLVMTDFRTLEVETVPLGDEACFLMCNTHARHALVDGEYNSRRQHCEEAAAFFEAELDHPVTALRDVSWEEWQQFAAGMDDVTARRAAHPIGENKRVAEGRTLLEKGDLESFGRLMFDSHTSSRVNFENSCRELDFLVDTASRIPGVLGARLSGGGFGGSAVVLLHPRDVETAQHALASAYSREFGTPCDIRVIAPANGARLVQR